MIKLPDPTLRGGVFLCSHTLNKGTMKRKLFSAMLTGTLLATPATALAETIRIGETTALIHEAALATEKVVDGGNGKFNFPYSNFKAIANIG